LDSWKLTVTLIWSLRCEVSVSVRAPAELIVQLPPTVAAPTGETVGVTVIDGQKGLHTDARRVKDVEAPRASEGGPVTSTAPDHPSTAERRTHHMGRPRRSDW
jgi:hypothetical protein